MKTRLLILLFFGLSFSLVAQRKAKPQSTTTGTLEQRLQGVDAQLQQLLADWHAAGFAVSVVYKDKVIFAKGYGYRDVDKKLAVTPNTLFAIGSCTKAFTSALIGQLQKEGKVELDKPVTAYLPTLRFFNDQLSNQITVRDMMCHRTGLPRHDLSWYLFPTTRDSLLQRIQYMEPSAPLRQRWQYNNFMFLTQGVLAEKLTGKSWEALINEKFFQPLGMKTSNLSVVDMPKSEDASLGYGVKKDSLIDKLDYFNIGGMAPAGSINSSVVDMANWVKVWINGGKFNGKEILPASYVQEAMSSQMVIAGAIPSKEVPDVFMSNYGFGWFLAAYRGHYRVEHGGNIDGFSASTSFYPSDSLGIVVLTNQNGSPLPGLIRNIISDRVLGLSFYDWNGDRKKAVAKAKADQKSVTAIRKTNTKPSHPLSDYAGIFTHPGYGTMDIQFKGDSLFMPTVAHRYWLRHVHYDIFEPFETKGGIDTTDHGPIKIQFTMNGAGDIDGIHALGIEPTIPAPIAFKKGVRPQAITADNLKKYEGEYELGGAPPVKLYLNSASKLIAVVPGQPDYELVPTGPDHFAIKGLTGFAVLFSLSNGSVTGLTFEQPNGNFRLTKKSAALAEKK